MNEALTSSPIEIPEDYVVNKLYQYGYKTHYNTGDRTYVTCCPICREGKSWGKKQRCYYIPEKNLIYCHNCGWSSRPLKWLMTVMGVDSKYILNEIKGGDFDTLDLDKKVITESYINSSSENLPIDSINLFNPVQLNYYKSNSIVLKALDYLKKRHLTDAINGGDLYVSLNDNLHKNRIIIPFKNMNGDVVYYQSRSFDANPLDKMDKIKYLSKKGSERTLFGIDRISSDCEYIFVLEGPIDAMFIHNGVGLAGINTSSGKDFSPIQKEQITPFLLTHKIVWCLDSQWLDETARKKSLKLIKNGESVFIWPEYEGKLYKDFNEFCSSKNVNQVDINWVLKNTYKGDAALLKWKLLFGGF